MSQKQVVLVVLASIGAMGLLFLQLFELRDVPDLDWKETYAYESKQPFGTWMLASLLEARYPEHAVVRHYSDTLLSLISSQDNLYMQIEKNPTFNRDEIEILSDFLRGGNDVLLIGEHIDLSPFVDFNTWNYSRTYDSVLTVRYASNLNQAFECKYFRQDLTQSFVKTFQSFSRETLDSLGGLPIGHTQDDQIIFAKWPIGNGHLYIHLVPSMFNNLASQQPFYLDHFNHFFDYFDPNLIVLDHPSLQVDKRSESESPLQFILSQRSLSWAYYLLIFSAALFVLSRGRRIQKVIPTIEPNNNTSLEYVRAVSSLYEQQGQHKKLVKHLRSIFIHTVKSKYFLDYHDRDFVTKLSKKSGIRRDEIEAVVNRFENIDKRLSFDGNQLMNIFNKLEAFYKQSK